MRRTFRTNQDLRLTKLEQMLRDGTDGIFSYSVDITSWTETDEETGEPETWYHYEYTVEYAGDTYFADHVFHLTKAQAETAGYYAASLYTFLFDTVYHVELNPDLIPGETGNTAVNLALTKLGTPYSHDSLTAAPLPSGFTASLAYPCSMTAATRPPPRPATLSKTIWQSPMKIWPRAT